jgi:hypothetical protein
MVLANWIDARVGKEGERGSQIALKRDVPCVKKF